MAEIRGTINQMRNTFDGMNSSIIEAEEIINNLEKRVMESNQAQQERENKYAKGE